MPRYDSDELGQLKSQWEVMFSFWGTTKSNSFEEAFIEEELDRHVARIDAAFKRRYNIRGGIDFQQLVNASSDEKLQYCALGENVLSVELQFIKHDDGTNPNLTRPEVDSASIVCRAIIQESFRLSILGPCYKGLAIAGLMAHESSEGFDLKPVVTPLYLAKIVGFPE